MEFSLNSFMVFYGGTLLGFYFFDWDCILGWIIGYVATYICIIFWFKISRYILQKCPYHYLHMFPNHNHLAVHWPRCLHIWHWIQPLDGHHIALWIPGSIRLDIAIFHDIPSLSHGVYRFANAPRNNFHCKTKKNIFMNSLLVVKIFMFWRKNRSRTCCDYLGMRSM